MENLIVIFSKSAGENISGAMVAFPIEEALTTRSFP